MVRRPASHRNVEFAKVNSIGDSHGQYIDLQPMILVHASRTEQNIGQPDIRLNRQHPAGSPAQIGSRKGEKTYISADIPDHVACRNMLEGDVEQHAVHLAEV